MSEDRSTSFTMSSPEIARHLKEIYPEFEELDVDEVLLMQESAYLHIQSQRQKELDMDEDIARALELDDDFDLLQICDNEASSDGSTVAETSIRGESRRFTDDDIDPDEMSYEELRSLGESAGSESRGLSAYLISRLPTFRYKCAFFWNRKNIEKEECVICCSAYTHGAKMTSLPCAHRYHTKCINRWLLENKSCPICQNEVKV